MVSLIPSTPTLDLLQQVAEFGERRHEILAGNIANISTPNYRMRDLPVKEFQLALKQAVAALHTSNTPVSGATGIPENRSIGELFPSHLFRSTESPSDNVTFQDANNRSLEKQTMEMIKNSMMQSLALQLIRFQLNSVQSVISEQP